LSNDAVVHYLTNRRLYLASARVLDAVADELAEVRARTGSGSFSASDEWAGIGVDAEFSAGMHDVSLAAAYQASMRTATTIRQRSLSDFLK